MAEMSLALRAHYLGEPLPEGVTIEQLRAEQLALEAAQAAEAAAQAATNQPTTQGNTDVPGNNGTTTEQQPRKRG